MRKSNELSGPRRAVPPLPALVAFEAASRHLSFTRASEELSLTQSAISRQITLLEELLGVPLFERVRQRVTLTPAGRFYAEQVRDVLARLTMATEETVAFRGQGGTLRLRVPPTFGTRWLIPRMGRFFERYPEVTVSFTTRLPGVIDFRREGVDAAIHVGEEEWPGVVFHRLTSGELVAVAAPALVKSLMLRAPEDLRHATLLIHRSRPESWSKWFEAHGLGAVGARPTLAFEQFTMVFQAAIAGLGVAVAPSFLVQPELASGELVALFEPIIEKDQGDFFAYPVEKKDFAPVAAFRDWILKEAAVPKEKRGRH
ncbi:MAG TPA: LysR substrate-binding domain-containing protein [Stellaceae bacterium]|nr:LysR substrate-binding domain-containing protein [Stellaceae bacterium]